MCVEATNSRVTKSSSRVLHAGAAFAAALLRAVGGERHTLDVTGVRNRDDHLLALDQVLVFHLAFLVDDDGAARGCEFAFDGGELVLDDRLDARARAQDVEIIGDLVGELVELGLDLIAAERGEPLQPQIEDRLGLLGRQLGRAFRRDAVARIVDQGNHGGDVARRPVALHQFVARFVGVLGGADQLDHLVDIGDRDGKSDQDVRAVARLA